MLCDKKLWSRMLSTWKTCNPKIHVSTQAHSKRKGSHSDFINTREIDMRKIWNICKKNKIDIMIEAKKKDLALDKLRKYLTILP